MKTPLPLLAALAGLALSATGCKNYSTARESQPSYASVSPAGQKIVQALKRPERQPEAQMGRFIDAAAAAAAILEKHPNDVQARRDYNFAVARLFDVIRKSGLKPWVAPVICPGVGGNWRFSMVTDGRPEHNPSNFRMLPADRFQFHGTLVRERSVKEGLGAPMIVASTGFDPTRHDPFVQGKKVYYGITLVLRFRGRNCTAEYLDPLAVETVKLDGHVFPLAADFTAPLGLALSDIKPRKTEILRMFKPEKFVSTTRLARLQPYDPKKIPILFIHGLGDSQATWAPMVAALRGDPTIRRNYQMWFFSYPTGFPYPLSAVILRRKMDEINAFYPDHKPIVVIGHSMGGMIARILITDSGLKIWNAFFSTPPEKTPLSDRVRPVVVNALIFQHRPEISRVIFASASLGGAEMATDFMGRIGSKIMGSPPDLANVSKEMTALVKPRADGKKGTLNSIGTLDPNNRFVTTINTIPPAGGIPYHAIIGDRGKGGHLDHTRPQSTDGIVPYWSSHIAGAKSELIIPSHHWSIWHPAGIAEVERILKLHLQGPSK